MKVLVISNNCFSKTQNMGKTLSGIFSGFSKDDICQLYFYASIPDGTVCREYFRISDYDLLKGKLFGSVGGIVVPRDVGEAKLYESENMERIYRKMNRNRPWMSFLRTWLWDIARWNSPKLNKWICEMRPDVVFFASGDSVFAYKIVDKISRKYHLPVISYICDDYYGCQVHGFFAKSYQKLLKKWMHKVFSSSCLLTTICDSLGAFYQKIFGVDYYVLHTGTKLKPCVVEEKRNCLCYMGNVGLNRWKSLIQIGEALCDYNMAHDTDYRLEIYSGTKEPHIIKAFGECPSIVFCGWVDYEQSVQIMQRSMAVIHTESFAPEDISRVKYSMSTKIADGLACGTCLLAYGSEELASIQYLQTNDAAIVITESGQLREKLEAVFDPDTRKRVLTNAQSLAAKNHNAVNNSLKFNKECTMKAGVS